MLSSAAATAHQHKGHHDGNGNADEQQYRDSAGQADPPPMRGTLQPPPRPRPRRPRLRPLVARCRPAARPGVHEHGHVQERLLELQEAAHIAASEGSSVLLVRRQSSCSSVGASLATARYRRATSLRRSAETCRRSACTSAVRSRTRRPRSAVTRSATGELASRSATTCAATCGAQEVRSDGGDGALVLSEVTGTRREAGPSQTPRKRTPPPFSGSQAISCMETSSGLAKGGKWATKQAYLSSNKPGLEITSLLNRPQIICAANGSVPRRSLHSGRASLAPPFFVARHNLFRPRARCHPP